VVAMPTDLEDPSASPFCDCDSTFPHARLMFGETSAASVEIECARNAAVPHVGRDCARWCERFPARRNYRQ